jgi:hypothetical protein
LAAIAGPVGAQVVIMADSFSVRGRPVDGLPYDGFEGPVVPADDVRAAVALAMLATIAFVSQIRSMRLSEVENE